jgi:hypothetical protein
MFKNLFKKDSESDGADSALQESTAATEDAERAREWQARFASAADETAVLQLAYDAPTIELKLTALGALKQEDSFKHAMRAFREQDKRLYRAAKTRWEEIRDRRLANAEGGAIVSDARALLDQEQIPANRLVELDARWSNLNTELLEPELPAGFTAARAELGTKVRAHGEQSRALGLWFAAVDDVQRKLALLLPGVAQGDTAPTAPEPFAVSLLDLLGKAPDAAEPRCAEKLADANRQLALAASVTQRAQFLQSLPAAGAADAAAEKAAIEQWRSFPELAEGGAAHAILAQRFADWRNAGIDARKRDQDAHKAQERARRTQQDQQRNESVLRLIETAEAAHVSGHVAELASTLGAIDAALKRGSVNANLAQRVETLRREHQRLQDWQRWSGGLGREQLAAEAQTLAQQATGRISIKAHTDAIAKLRERWKELDKLGAASNQSIWLAFDGALKRAYEPIVAHLDKLKQARVENLATREQIIAQLTEAAAKLSPAATEAGETVQPDWRAVARTLEQARIAWQKLGPVEHTVPRGALQGENAVTSRYGNAVQALQVPLQAVYDSARREREQLIRSAKEIGTADVSARDVVDKVRALQARWQANAKALALPRGDENALWSAFKQATDAIFAARDAKRAAKEEASNAQVKGREEIIERLSTFASSGAAGEIKRVLADADSAWRAAADVPKPVLAKLDARYRAAREALTKQLAALAKRGAQARFDALLVAIALCAERESADEVAGGEPNADLEARWNGISDLPPAWRSALKTRWEQSPTASTAPGEQPISAMLDALLNLEAACHLESPGEFAAARHQLKMRALKSALESRQSTAHTPADIERWLLSAAAFARPDALSRERLEKIIEAIKLGRAG